MRIDQLPKSDRIEDRRGGLSGIPGGRGGIGIGTVVILGLIGWALGIDPRIRKHSGQPFLLKPESDMSRQLW